LLLILPLIEEIIPILRFIGPCSRVTKELIFDLIALFIPSSQFFTAGDGQVTASSGPSK
jgi:hypothetical protein